MIAPSFDTVLYKVLAYLYSCMQRDVRPNLDKMREVSGVGDEYFKQVLHDAVEDGLISGIEFRHYICDQDETILDLGPRITRKGVTLLETDSGMSKAAKFLGTSFQTVLSAAVEATIRLALGA